MKTLYRKLERDAIVGVTRNINITDENFQILCLAANYRCHSATSFRTRSGAPYLGDLSYLIKIKDNNELKEFFTGFKDQYILINEALFYNEIAFSEEDPCFFIANPNTSWEIYDGLCLTNLEEIRNTIQKIVESFAKINAKQKEEEPPKFQDEKKSVLNFSLEVLEILEEIFKEKE